ncbi:hypothetical protein BDF20DRAFT_818710, partial [Mycotypha africana]|uniref:uncharacterized protein n=1 Tax=Mycotypha africana TaxID=64632 RepID=UPI002301B521
LIELITTTLKKKAELLKTETVVQLGEGFQYVTAPWALVFMKHDNQVYNELLNRNVKEGYHPKERTWLDSIRVCKVETFHQIRAILTALHIKPGPELTKNSLTATASTMGAAANSNKTLLESSILHWKQNEKYGQPPSCIFVIDLLDILVSNSKVINDNESLKYLSLK